MADPFVGEIRIFAGDFAPRGWVFCNGQILPISQHTALFSLLGTIYGGDGRTTFGLPDMRGRLPLHPGNGPGLTSRRLGEKSGNETESLTVNQLPTHSHAAYASRNLGNAPGPASRVPATGTTFNAYIDDTPNTTMHGDAVAATGGGAPHTNLQPYLCMHFIIALEGTYPSRS